MGESVEAVPQTLVLEELADRLAREGAFAEAQTALERAYALAVDAGEVHGALRIVVRLVGMCSGAGQNAASRGWEQRGQRLIGRVAPCVEEGYLALCRAGCEYADPRQLQERARLALEVAARFGDRELEVRALGDLGLAQVSLGRVDEGFALLDEAMTAVAARELANPITRGLTVCSMLSACQRTGDTVRAAYWCERVSTDDYYRELGFLGAHCRLVEGAVDALCGRWDTAEARLIEASDEGSAASVHRVEARAVLADLRLSQGRYDEAEELMRGDEDSLVVAPVLARLRTARGNCDEAAALLRAAARGFSSDLIRLAPVLAQLVDLELRRGDTAAAERAARRLAALEEQCSSNEVRALARLAVARIALHADDGSAAVEELETALTLLVRLDRPLLTAQIRLEMARALTRCDDHAGARVEAEAALATFTRLRVAPDIAAGQQLLTGLGTVPSRGRSPLHQAGAVETLTPRESEVAHLVAEGLTNRDIAKRLFLSVRTVETHVDRALGKLGFRTRTQLAGWVHDSVVAVR